MKNLAFTCVALFTLSVFGIVGCGSGGNQVTQPPADAPEVSELPSQQGYEAAMKNQKNRPGN